MLEETRKLGKAERIPKGGDLKPRPTSLKVDVAGNGLRPMNLSLVAGVAGKPKSEMGVSGGPKDSSAVVTD